MWCILSECSIWLYGVYMNGWLTVTMSLSRNVWNRLLWRSIVDTGFLSNNKKPLHSPECYMTFWRITICSDTLHWLDITPTCDLVTELDLITEVNLFTKLEEFSIKHLQQVWHADRDAYSFGHLFTLRLSYFLMLRPVSPNLSCFWTFEFRTSLAWYFYFTPLLMWTSILFSVINYICSF